MRLSALLFLGVCVILTNVPLSEQYGTIFADTVLPVKSDFVHFPDTTSDHVDTGVLDVGGLTLSDPGGFNVNIPQHIDIRSGDSIELIGELGFALGSPNTQLVNVTVAGNLQTRSQDFFASFSQVNFNINHPNDFDASIEFDSARYLSTFANDVIDIDAANLLAVQSVHGNLDAFAPNVFGSGAHVPIVADDSVTLVSRTGFIDFTAEEGIFAHADIIDLISEQNTEMVADRDLTVHAEDLVEITSGRHVVSALGDLNFSSERNVDFTSPSGFFINAKNDIDFTAENEFYLKASEESISQLTAVAQNRIGITATDNGIIGSRNLSWEIFKSQSVIANSMIMDSVSTTRIGNEETSSVHFNAISNAISFTLDNDSGNGDEIDFIARSIEYNVSNDLFFNADQFRTSSGSSILSIGAQTSISGNDVAFESTSELGYVNIESQNVQDYTADDNIKIDGHSSIFTASTITSTSTDSIDLFFASSILVEGDTINVSATDSSIKGGNLFVTADELVFAAVSANGSPQIDFISGDDMSVHVSGPYEIDGDNIEMYSSNNFQFLAENDISLIASNDIDIEIDDDGFFISHGSDLQVVAGNDLEFVNIQDESDDDDLMSFAFGRDINFTSDAFNIDVDDQLLFDAGQDINLIGLDDVVIESKEVSFTTLSDRFNSGISFDASDSTIFSQSGGKTSLTGYNVNFEAENYEFTTPLFTMTGSERLDFIGSEVNIDASSVFDLASDGHVLFDSGDDINLSVLAGPLAFIARDSINITSSNIFQQQAKTISYNSDSFEFVAEDLDFDISNGFDVVAGTTTPGSTINFFSGDDMHFFNEEFVTINAPDVLFKSSGDQNISAQDDITVVSPTILINGDSMDTTLTGDLSIEASDVDFSTDEFQAFFDSESGPLTFIAQKSVYLTSDGDIDFTGSTLEMNADNQLTFVGDDSLSWNAATTLLIQNQLDTESIEISSGGRTAFFSDTKDVSLQSSDTFNVEAGRIIMDAWNENASGAVFLANIGNIEMKSAWGSIHFDSNLNVLLNATNTDTTASHFFTSTEGVRMSTQQGGIYFNSEGFLAGGALAFEFLSTGNNGDIFYDSELGGINLLVRDDIQYNAGRNISLVSAFGAEFTPQEFMSFTAPAGQLDVNAQRGITINAGEGQDNADIIFTQLQGSFVMSVADQITFHSTGVVDNESILIDGQSDIRFHTANTGDITFLANGLLSFDALGSFTATSTNNMNVSSEAGSVSISAVTGAEFTTEGGPIYFATFSTDPDAEDTITAQTGNIELDSGNSTYITGEQEGTFTANTGISFTSLDGSLDVLAASANSFIRFISMGGMLISSTGNDLSTDDAIVLEAGNNIEFGTIDTESIAINSIDRVIVGNFSRPVVTFNAAGSDEQIGFSIVSDGGIVIDTESEFISDIGGDLLIDTQLGITSVSYGPTTFNTIGSKGIFLNSNAGLLRITGDDQLSLISNTQIVATSSGAVRFVAEGEGAANQIRFTAPDVEILSGNHQIQVDVLDADLTNSFTLTTSGDGIFDGTLDENNSISFDATEFFEAVSGDELTIATSLGNGPILFQTLKESSNIDLITDTQSDIEFAAQGEFGVFADTFDMTAPDISFSAIHTDNNDNRELGDIEIGAENNIDASSVEDFNISGDENVLIETTGSDGDIGAPITMTATSEVSITSTRDMTIRNVAGQGGELSFFAESDVSIANTNSQGWITIDADGTLTQTSTRNNELLTQSYFAHIDESYSVTTAGRDSNDDFGIRMDVEENELTFKALFGAIRFNSETSSAELLSQDSINIDTDGDGLLQGEQVTITTITDFIDFDATRAAIELSGSDGLDFDVGTSLSLNADGLDDNSDHGIAFEANSSGLFEIETEGNIDIVSAGAFFDAKTIDIDGTNTILLEATNGDLAVEADDQIDLFASNLNFDSLAHMQLEAGSILVNAEATVGFVGNGGDIVIETTGSDAFVDLFSSGETSFIASGINVHTERRPNSDVNIIGTLARIEFDAAVGDANNFSLDFTADHGDVVITAEGDDSDIYIDTTTVSLTASNDISIVSNNVETDLNGFAIDSNTNSIDAQGTIGFLAGADLGVRSNSISLRVGVDISPGNGGEGGTLLFTSNNDIVVEGNSINILALQDGGEITVSSRTGNINFVGTLDVDSRAVMKIPYNMNDREVNFDSTTACVNRSFYWTDNILTGSAIPGLPGVPFDDTVGYLCVCDNGTPRCSPFYEPPCDPATDSLCTQNRTF